MTQHQISHPEGLKPCKAGHSARHMLDLRGPAAGGGHFIECRCGQTHKHAEPEAALAEWRRMNRPARNSRPSREAASADNVLQFKLGLAEPATKRRRMGANANGGRP